MILLTSPLSLNFSFDWEDRPNSVWPTLEARQKNSAVRRILISSLGNLKCDRTRGLNFVFDIVLDKHSPNLKKKKLFPNFFTKRQNFLVYSKQWDRLGWTPGY